MSAAICLPPPHTPHPHPTPTPTPTSPACRQANARFVTCATILIVTIVGSHLIIESDYGKLRHKHVPASREDVVKKHHPLLRVAADKTTVKAKSCEGYGFNKMDHYFVENGGISCSKTQWADLKQTQRPRMYGAGQGYPRIQRVEAVYKSFGSVQDATRYTHLLVLQPICCSPARCLVWARGNRERGPREGGGGGRREAGWSRVPSLQTTNPAKVLAASDAIPWPCVAAGIGVFTCVGSILLGSTKRSATSLSRRAPTTTTSCSGTHSSCTRRHASRTRHCKSE